MQSNHFRPNQGVEKIAFSSPRTGLKHKPGITFNFQRTPKTRAFTRADVGVFTNVARAGHITPIQQ